MLEKCYWIAVACNGHTVHANHLRLSHQTPHAYEPSSRVLRCVCMRLVRTISPCIPSMHTYKIVNRVLAHSLFLLVVMLQFVLLLHFHLLFFFFVSSLLPVDLIRFRFVSFSIYYVYYIHLLVILSFHIENRFKPSLSHYTDDHVMLSLKYDFFSSSILISLSRWIFGIFVVVVVILNIFQNNYKRFISLFLIQRHLFLL